MEEQVKIYQLDPITYEYQDYKILDKDLIPKVDLDTVFSSSTDYIEYYIYDENQNKVYPTSTQQLTSFNVKNGDILLNPQNDLSSLGFDIGIYNISYSFYRKRLSSDINSKYFIKEISSDRTEIRLDSNTILNEDIIDSTTEFISYRESSPYFVDFYLNFGNNQTVISNNLRLDQTDSEDPTILVKLYEPLPNDFDVKSPLWVVESISQTQLYKVDFPFTPTIEQDFEYISGPNYSIDVKTISNETTQEFSYNTLLSSNVTSSNSQLKNLLSQKGMNVDVNYEDFNDFIHFSSAKTRLENFIYKIQQIENIDTNLNSLSSSISSQTNSYYITDKDTLESQKSTIIENFDGYENFLYYTSGSQYTYPKSNLKYPYNLYSPTSPEVDTWLEYITPLVEEYDENNQNYLKYSIPEYLREDPENRKYELFIDMVGQHYDNIWIYTKGISNKFNADNRLEYGISKDLVADAIRDFGIKLYSNNFDINDLYTSFLGVTPNGSYFPYPNMTGSLPVDSGYEYVDTYVTSSNTQLPLNDLNKRLYKRIYHNIPYLLKTKGTMKGLRALITSYGIPDTILRISEFGGKDKDNTEDWDLKQNIFNYSLSGSISTPFTLEFSNTIPESIQFRVKSKNITSSTSTYQSLWVGKDNTNTNISTIVVEKLSPSTTNYTGNIYFFPDITNLSEYISLEVPIFNGDWWGIMLNINPNGTYTLYSSNQKKGSINTYKTSTLTTTSSPFNTIETSDFLKSIVVSSNTYTNWEGYLQEVRYYTQEVDVTSFKDYILNPFSITNNKLNECVDTLGFRGSLGSILGISNTTSIHPKSQGPTNYVTSSFSTGNDFSVTGSFEVNREYIHQDQPNIGIKNRITDKTHIVSQNYSEQPSGSNVNEIMLSPYISVEHDPLNDTISYNPEVRYLEVGFSPQDQINDDINSQLGFFNIGDYIGDPRDFSSDSKTYPSLDKIRDEYFLKYSHTREIKDFIRLIKFFDNSLFKMIKDFTPANTSLSSGVIIKQHKLERNRQRPAQASWQNITYSGSIKPQSRNYNTGSGDTGIYEYENGSSIYRFSGGAGGSLNRFNNLPESNIFNLNQTYSESIEGSIVNTINNEGEFVGYRDIKISDEKEFYDGEFSGSNIEVTDKILNPNCGPYLQVSDTPIIFNPIVFSLTNSSILQGTTTEGSINSRDNNPQLGDAWIVSERTQVSPIISKVKYIKLSNFDINGVFIGDYLNSSNTIKWVTSDANVFSGNRVVEYHIEGVTVFADSVLLRISQTQGDNVVNGSFFPITSSQDGGSENWSLIARGDFKSSNNLSQSNDSLQQGNFINGASDNQTQHFWYYNGTTNDELSLFNSGAADIPLNTILNNPSFYNYGSYNPNRTTNIPWFISASISYSASDLGTGNTITSSNNLYHSASKYSDVGLVNQDFTLSNINPSGKFIPSPLITDTNASTFKPTYNNLIPGNEYEVTGIGGHPRIQLDGTASIDFYFPSLTIGGTKRPLSEGGFLFTPLSGSALTGSNNDFSNLNFFPSSIMEYSSSAQTHDGALNIDYDRLDFYINEFQNLGREFTTGYIYYDLIIQGSTGFTASLFLNEFSDSGESGYTDLYPLNPFISDGLNKIEIDGSDFNFGINREAGNNQGCSFRIELKTSEDNFNYHIEDFSVYMSAIYTDNGGGGTVNIPSNNNPIFSINNFQTNPIGGNQIEIIPSPSLDAYPTLDVQVFLKRTGSGIPPEGYIITSSDKLVGEDIFGSKTFTFPDSPILNIFEPNPNLESTTINIEDDMYFLEYSMSNYSFINFSDQFLDVDFLETGDTGSKIIIEQRADTNGADYFVTGSLFITQGNGSNPSNVGVRKLFREFIVPTSESINTVSLTGSLTYPFIHDDTFRMGIEVNKGFGSGLTITDYTMSISPNQSVYAPITLPQGYNNYRTSTPGGFILPTYFGEGVLPFNLALDCQPLLNNYNDIRKSSFLMDIDYNNTGGSIIPVNQQQILKNTAIKSSIPDSNYTSIRSIRPRYKGTKTTSQNLNLWSIQDIDTYGKNPVIELKDAYFGYFKSIKDLYPLVNDKTSLELTYLLDEQSNAIPPNLEAHGVDILEKTFPKNNAISLGFISSSIISQELDDMYPVFKLAQQPIPILYSQTSSRGYTSELPLTGSSRISMYDNGDSNTFVDYSFVAQGTASWDEGMNTQFGTYTQVIDPTEDLDINPYDAGVYNNPYLNGEITFNSVGGQTVNSNPQRLSMQTSFATSFLYESGKPELAVDIQMLKGNTGIPFTLEDISLKVYRTNQDPFDAGSIIGTGIDKLVRFISGKSNPKGNAIINKIRSRIFGSPNSRIFSEEPQFNSKRESFYMILENGPLANFLVQKGLYKRRQGGSKNKGDITGLEFVIKANSGKYEIQDGDNIKFQLKVDLRKSKRSTGNVLFPDDYTGPIFPSKVSAIGERSALLAGDNKGTPPYWVYTGSAGGNNDILDKSILVMSSSNINEAYGGDFYQGPTEYTPGPTEYFDKGVEPRGTQFPKIKNPILFFPGDEIRFGNNENYSYIILEVIPPEANIENGKGRLKIRLSGKVPESINKNFFVVRRYIPKSTSFIIDTQFPYSFESSGSNANGIVYPTFPTDNIRSSGSVIVTDLISKGVIK